MSYVPLEQLLEKSGDSIYKLVVMASKRALEISEGKPKLIDMSSAIKPSTIALHEIIQGKLQYKKARAG
ncbi:DNA-directed RNA polymerase subunit omega [Candidatus Omnitrophota bacterium]